MPKDSSANTSLRTPLGRVRGMGSARSGTHHWWTMRVTSLALLPLTLWFVVSMIRLADASYLDTLLWIAAPVNAILMLVLIGLTFHHMAAGLQVIIEDYVRHEFRRMAVILLVKAVSLLLAIVAGFSVLRIAFAL